MSQGALVFAATMAMNLCGFVFHMIAGHKLGPAVYGSLVALLSMSIVATLPIALFSPVVVKFAAEFRALHDDSHVRGLTADVARVSSILGAAFVVASLVGMHAVSNFMHVPVWAVVITALFIAISLPSNALRSVAQGTQRFTSYSISITLEGLSRVVLLLALAVFGLTGGLLSLLVGATIGVGAIAYALVKRYRTAPVRPITYDWRRIGAVTWGSAASACAAALIGNVDVIIVKHKFPAFEAGIYSAVSLGGRILLYLVSFISIVLLPQAADRHARGERTGRTIGTALTMFAALSIVGLLVLRFGGTLLITVMFGTKFLAAVPLLTWYGLAMVFLALTSALCSYGIATHRLAFAVPVLVCTAGTLIAVGVASASLGDVVTILVIGTAVMAAASAFAIGMQARRGQGVAVE